MGKASRTKGVGAERELVTLLRANGLQARRVPLSGALPDADQKGDVEVIVAGYKLRLESKRRAAGFSTLARWLGDNDALTLREDRGEWLIVMKLERVLDALAALTKDGA